jgi:hypothetical protein
VTCTSDELQPMAATVHVSTCVSLLGQLVVFSSQRQLEPRLQHPLPPQDVVPVEVGPSEQLASVDEIGVHEKGWHLHCESVAWGQP